MGAHTDQRRAVFEVKPPTLHGELAFRWRISGDAIRARRPDLDLGAGDAVLCIRLHLEEQAQSRRISAARATLESTRAVTCPIEHADTTGAWWRDDPLIHVDVQGLVAATLRAGRPDKLLYARTPLMEALGLPPGVYQPDACELILHAR
jgi:hypothetical protein